MERIGKGVERELGRAGGGSGERLRRLAEVWPAAVGETVARHAWPLRLSRDETLQVATSSSTWAFELDRLAAEILARLREHAGEHAPPALRFRVGPVPEPGAPKTPQERAQEVSQEPPPEVPEASAAAAAIEDPELRELVERAARASLLGARSRRRF
ncbi:MAG TPA: DUF721 domain-containing protein [Gaiellaceae bacterium]|nr:DUF721 domain-containing protein [Gaiellaceae bacterium]